MNRESVKPSVFPFVFGVAVTLLAIVVGATMAGASITATPTQNEWAATARPAGPLLPNQADGAAVYSQSCSSCHQPDGVGVPGSFPPLAGNPNAADPAYVDEVIRDGVSGPIDVDGVTYDAVMPAVALSDDERSAVVDYVVELASAVPSATDSNEPVDSPEPAAPVVGDIDRGRDFFTGSTRFENGGGACASCHQAGDVGHMGGASLGPDLDASFANLGGEAGLSAWLATPASPTMQPIFDNEPLTESEIADVVAFLETAPERERPRSYGDGLLLGGLAGMVLLLGGMALARRTMNPSYIERLRSKR